METTNYPTTVLATSGLSSCHGGGQTSGGWFSRWRGLILGSGVIVAIVALALRRHWIAAAALMQLLFLLPCALMMLMYMQGMHHDQQTGGQQVAPNPDKSTGTSLIPG